MIDSISKSQLEYQHRGLHFQAYVAEPSSRAANRPAVLIFPAWNGRDTFACQKADQLAQLGYLGVAMDVYGDGKVGKSREENQTYMAPLLEDRLLLRNRLLAGFEAVQNRPGVDPHRIGAIGFCFGGLCALDLARSGAPIQGAVSFHGNLTPPTNLKNDLIRAKILVLHGYEDPQVPSEQVRNFEKEMTLAGADWQVHIYSQTKHGFTNPQANDPGFGTVYHPLADQRSWQAMKNHFEEVFHY
jgi:dienelactone hydrolase